MSKETQGNGGWGRGVPRGRLARGTRIVVKPAAEGYQYAVTLDGRVLTRAIVIGSRSVARAQALRSAEAMGLIQDGV